MYRFVILGSLLLTLLSVPAGASFLLAQPQEIPTIRLKSASFDPLKGEPVVPAGLRAVEAPTSITTYLIQFDGPITEAGKAAVTATGAQLHSYLPDYAFLARMDGTTAARVRGLAGIRWVGLYHPAYRLAPEVTRMAAQANGPLNVLIQTLPDADLTSVADTVQRGGGVIRSKSANRWVGAVRATVAPAHLNELARQDGVLWIGPFIEPQLYNDVGGGSILRVNEIRPALGLYGAGQIVAVADSGLDMGTTGAAMSDDFEGRIVQGFAMCSLFQGGRTTWDDLNGHGTHVAGSVLGNGLLSGSNPGTHTYGSSFAGVAPEAQVYFQAIDHDGDSGLECIPDPAAQGSSLFGPAYDAGARIHTNSWGGPTGDQTNPYGGYDGGAQAADQAAWDHQDMLILYAAGNSGKDNNGDGVVDPDSIGSPGTAKNVLTVGASENLRTDQTTTWSAYGFNASPLASDRIATNAKGMAAFSSRGPTDDGRIKPDVAAPGTRIISARTHVQGAQTEPYNEHYAYSDGTSMATPLTAGAAALVREWLVRLQNIAAPSGALIKAMVLNGAADMSPGQYGSGSAREIPAIRPNNVSGWGRVDLVQSLNPPAPQALWFRDHSTGLATGESVEYQFSIGVPGFVGDEGQGTNAGGLASAPAAIPGTAGQPATATETFTPSRTPRLRLPAQVPQPNAAPMAQVLQNPGFESGLTSWQTLAGSPSWVTNVYHSGTASARFGGDGLNSVNDQLFQLISIPANTSNITLNFWYGLYTDETIPGYDFFCYDIVTEDLSTILVEDCVDIGWSGPKNWTQVIYTLSSAQLNSMVGQNVYFGYALVTDSSAVSQAWVDDVIFDLTTSGPSPTTTETAVPGSGPVRVTLAWTDYPGSTAAAKALVNDLDLEVIAPSGTSYRGNQGAYTGSAFACVRDGLWDNCNNVEGVVLPQAVPGSYRVIVRGYQVPQGLQGKQPFALVASGLHLRALTTDPSPTATTTESATATHSPTATASATASTTATPSPSATTGEGSPTPTVTNTPPPGSSFTATTTATASATATGSPTPSATATGSATATVPGEGSPTASATLTATASATLEPEMCYDFNGSSDITVSDLQMMAGLFEDTAHYNPTYDPNDDGRIDVSDFVIVTEVWGRSC